MRACTCKLAVLTALLLIALLSTPASAQAGRRRGGGGGTRGGTGSTTGGLTQPPSAQQVQNDPTVQADQKLAADAREVFNAATKSLDALFIKLMADFENTPDVIAAKQAVKDARAALDAAKTPVLEALKTKPEYIKAAADESAAKKKMSDLKNAAAPQPQIEAQAAEVFRLGSITSDLQRNALDDSSEVRAAQKRLTIATTRLNEMRESYRLSLKDNPDYQAAQAAKDDAEKKLTEANAKLTADSAKAAGKAP